MQEGKSSFQVAAEGGDREKVQIHLPNPGFRDDFKGLREQVCISLAGQVLIGAPWNMT